MNRWIRLVTMMQINRADNSCDMTTNFNIHTLKI